MGSNRPAARNQRAKLAADLNDLFKDLQSAQVKAVGNYHLGEVIGQGTYGKVKLATHALTGQQVAVKIVAKAHAAIITREIYHWRGLCHANIAHLHEVLTTESKIYLVTEYCPKGELLEALIRDGRCKPALAKRWFRQICLAIQYCHIRKIVHRDLKLENILLDNNNNIKLIDFGFTRECESKKLLESYCGSAAYTAPEIIVGKKYSGPEADIWSLGVILYTLLAGYLPFDDDNEKVVQDKIVDLDYDLPAEFFCKDAQDLIQGILKEDPNERLSIEQILNHPWWTPHSDDDEQEEAKDEQEVQSQDDPSQSVHHGRQGSLTKREIHPAPSTQQFPPNMYSSSPQYASPLAQYPNGAWGNMSPYTFNPIGDTLRASFSGGAAVPSPMTSPLPSPSPMVNKTFPRYGSGYNDGPSESRSTPNGGFPSNAFEQRLFMTLGKIGFDQDILIKSVPANACDPGYGLWCLLVDQVRQRALENGTTVDWEQSVALMDISTITGVGSTGGVPNSALVSMESGKRSPRPMSDPSPTSSQQNLMYPQALSPSLTAALSSSSQQSQHEAELEQERAKLKDELERCKLEIELFKVEKQQLIREKLQLTEDHARIHPFESKELPPIQNTEKKQALSGQTPVTERAAIQDSGVSVSTSSTPHSSWELPEREGPAIPSERPRRKSKGILHSIKDRFFNSPSSDVDSNPSEYSPSPYPPSPVPPKHFAASTVSASSSTSSTTTYATTPKPLPAPPAHPYSQHLLQQPSVHSPLSSLAFKSASTSSLVIESGHATVRAVGFNAAASSDHLATLDSATETLEAPQKKGGFMTWITESATGTVLNRSPAPQSTAKVPKRLNNRSHSTADSFVPVSSGSKSTTSTASDEARPQIPAIPASFFQPIWKSPNGQGHSSSASSSYNAGSNTANLASSAPSMSIRQRLASFSSSPSSAKISPEERQRAVAAAARAAALIAQPTLPERAHSPSPPSSPHLSSAIPIARASRGHQHEISDIVAAAVAATNSGHLQSSGSRKKALGVSSSKKTPGIDKGEEKGDKSQRNPDDTLNSTPSLQIPSVMNNGSRSHPVEIPIKGGPVARKASIKSSKTAMPSLMTAFSPFKPSKSVPSSPLAQHPTWIPTLVHDESTRDQKPRSSGHSRKESKDSKRNSISLADSSETTMPHSKERKDASSDDPATFGDGVVLQDESRPKKRTTSRTSITAASLGRKSNDSTTMGQDRSEPSSPRAATSTSPTQPSKRASLSSIDSRRSSTSGSMRDRNIFGLTLENTGSGSRKSSLNLSRTSLSKSTFHSPSASPSLPRRGGEMDRASHGYGRTSQDDEHFSRSGSMSRRTSSERVSMPGSNELPTLEKIQEGSSTHGSGSRTIRSLNNSLDGLLESVPLPILQPRDLHGSAESAQGQGERFSKSAGHVRKPSVDKVQKNLTISPSISASSSLTKVECTEGGAWDSHVAQRSSPARQGENPVQHQQNTEPRVDFTDGCSLIPSPPPSPPTSTQENVMIQASVQALETSEPLPEKASVLLEESKISILSTSYPPPRSSLSYNRASISNDLDDDELSSGFQGSSSPPSSSRPLVSFDQHFSNQAKIKDYRDGTPRKVINGFQPLAAKRLSKPGLPGTTPPGDVPTVPKNLNGQGASQTRSTSPSFGPSLAAANGPPNAFAGRRRGYRNSTGSMANMTLQQQQNFQQLQKEQLLRIQQNVPNAGYEATAAMKLNPRPRTGLFPKREYGGVALGGLGGLGGASVPSNHTSHGYNPPGSPGLHGNQSLGSSGADHDGAGGKRDSYSSRRQSMAVAMGKRPGAAPAAIQEEEE
ncbi:hypothetical protein EMPS_09974 [Entomortierella parvispora]|uniref:Protein kinase domain-containing protein n=1 Tax=Entomortierella parvispora TaxID=205924 RepID=A0A9P3HJA5_9FUNG|nr:hypothetical protein EMPS_09974 [Entomortierella parvispora]